MSSTDPFQDWLATLPGLGYPRDWIQRNLVGLRQRYETDPTAMEPCPDPPSKRMADRYEEL